MGPLSGYRIIEMAGIGPGPLSGMLFADMGAEVILVDRTSHNPASLPRESDICFRGRRSIAVDLKSDEGREVVLKLVESADAIIEGFRPGVMEKLGLGPDVCLARNPKLVYGRITGWGQTGPLAKAAGHDLNYIALTGALHGVGRKDEPPVPPLNLIGDYGGGAMFLAFGVVSGLLEAQRSGKGQVIDAAMVDGSSLLMSIFHSLKATGAWHAERDSNILDGGHHYYGCYETEDGKYVSLGAIEPQFYAEFLRLTGLDPEEFHAQTDRKSQVRLRARLVQLFKTRTQQEWCELLEGTDACFAPVIPFWEAHNHSHNQARQNHIELNGLIQPAPAPRFSRTVPEVSHAAPALGADTDAVLAMCGFSAADISRLRGSGVVV